MNQPLRKFLSLVLSASFVASGCQPTQPFYFREDGDLSHYLDVATQIEYPDVDEPSLDEVNGTLRPLTIKNTDNYEMWDLTLEEAIRITLCNSQVMRTLGGRVTSAGINSSVESLSRNILNPVATTTTYDPALVESGVGAPDGTQFSSTGVEAALSEFDARLDSSVFWEKNRRPQNRPGVGIGAAFAPSIFAQDTGAFTSGISKVTADGSAFAFRNNTAYEQNNIDPSFRPLPSDWQTNFEASFSRPLLQGGGTQYNRIAGPFSFQEYAAGAPAVIDGVVIARINTDLTLADFEGGVRDLTRDVEDNYWELYFAYRDLASRKLGRDSALETWKKTAALFRAGSAGGSADREAQARSQYFLFRAQVEQALTDLFRTENRLRYLMGISMSDGRLIRPADDPTTARVAFDWAAVHCESLVRRVEIRKEKWEIKKRELELIAARNHMLPRLDAVGRYRWLGLGDDLIDPARGAPLFDAMGNPQPGSNAFSNLTSGEFQEWQVGLQLSIPIGYRREMAQIRHHELLLARERAILQDLELEVSHQLGDAIRDIDLNHQLTQTNFNRRVAAEKEVQAVQASYEADRATLDLLLDAQRRRAEAESAYYRSLVDYNKAIMGVHYRKGSLLDYNGVFLAEGPWPGKAYFDALREARKRDASMYLDYGFTRPNVMSRGPYEQGAAEGCEPGQACDVEQFEYNPEQVIGPEVSIPQPAAPPRSHQSERELPRQGRSSNQPGGPTNRTASIRPPRPTDEHSANHPAAQTSADTPVWRWAQR
jgi:outer membrane protein TolC